MTLPRSHLVLGPWTGCQVVLDEGIAEILPAVDGAGRECLEPVEGVVAHHDREVSRHDVVVAAHSLDSDGVGAQPRLGIRLAVILLDPGWLEGGGPLDGPKLVGEGREAVEVIAGFVVVARSPERVDTLYWWSASGTPCSSSYRRRRSRLSASRSR